MNSPTVNTEMLKQKLKQEMEKELNVYRALVYGIWTNRQKKICVNM